MSKIEKSPRAGFSLIELILYIGIVSIIMTALVPFAWSVITSGTKNTTQQMVFAQSRFVSERIKYEIRNALSINSVSPSLISLSTDTPATNPTIIDLNAGQIRIKQGTGAVTSLISSDLVATDLVFTNYSSIDNLTKNIQFSLTIVASSSAAGHEYMETTSLRSAAEVRSN